MRAARLVIVAMLCVAGGCSPIDTHDPTRPDFSQALVELRLARALLEEPDSVEMTEPQSRAFGEIGTAITGLEARLGKRPKAPLPAPNDDVKSRADRFHYALLRLDTARLVLSRDEADPDRRALRNQTISAVARAQQALALALEGLLR